MKISFQNNGRNLLAMFFQGIFFNLLNLLLQYKFFIRFKPNKTLEENDLSSVTALDDDVAAEQIRIQSIMNKTKSSKNRYKSILTRKDKINVAQSAPNTHQHADQDDDLDDGKDYVKLVNLSKIFKKFKLKEKKNHS